jgi:malate dehydrogenase
MSSRPKVTIVGAGATGATCAEVLAQRDYAEIVLTDIKEGLPQGKALDINQMGPILGFEATVTGTNDYADTAGSDVVVITAGLPRQPGMSRDDLVQTNEKIVKSVTEQIVGSSPDAIIIVLSNPLDAMCHVAKSASGFPKERVFGGHGDQMVPVISSTTVGGVPLRKLVSEERIQSMVERTAVGGGELVKLLGTSAWYAPGAACAQMVDAVLLDEKRVLPGTVYLEGEYGIDGLYIGVPVKLGRAGIEEIYEVDLDDSEREALAKSADAVRDVVGVLSA